MAKKEVSATMFSFENQEVESKLSFKPREQFGNLCKGQLESVVLEEYESPKFDDKGVENQWEYAGNKVPRLVLTFVQERTNEDPRERYYRKKFDVIASRTNKGDEVPMKSLSGLYKQMYDTLRHIGNSYKGLKEYDLKLGNCPGIDPKASVEERIEQFKEFFQYFITVFNGTGGEEKPMYKGVKLWIKLVADYTTGKFLTFPGFVGKGFVERCVDGLIPSLEFEPNETVKLVAGKGKTEKAAATSTGTIGTTNADIENIMQKYA